MGCPFAEDVDSFEGKQGTYMNASNELQKTKNKLQELQVCCTTCSFLYKKIPIQFGLIEIYLVLVVWVVVSDFLEPVADKKRKKKQVQSLCFFQKQTL